MKPRDKVPVDSNDEASLFRDAVLCARLLWRDEVDHVALVLVAEIVTQRHAARVGAGDDAAIGVLDPLDHAAVFLFPAFVECRLLGMRRI